MESLKTIYQYRNIKILTIYMFTCLLVFSVELYNPIVNLTEKFNTDSGWTNKFSPNSNSVYAGWTNNYMSVKFSGMGAFSMPDVQKVFLIGLTNSSDGMFSGNFSKVDDISFDIQVINNPTLLFCFKSSNGITWNRTIDLKDYTNVWRNVSFPLEQDATWYSFIESTNLVPYFIKDKEEVCQFGFEIRRNIGTDYNKNNEINIDNVKLIGQWDKNTFTNGIALVWLKDNGLNPNEAGLDSDGDGANNYSEFLARTDPNDSNSVFSILIERDSEGKLFVKWKGNRYVSYDILTANNINDRFISMSNSIVSIFKRSGLYSSSDFNTNEYINVEVGEGNSSDYKKFYKVSIKELQ